MTTRILSGPATVAGLRNGRLIIMHALVTVDSSVAWAGSRGFGWRIGTAVGQGRYQ
jgi:hypothetical protein